METQEKTKITLNIGGMACSRCADTVQKALNDIDGLTEVQVDLENKSASVTFDSDSVSTDDFKKAVEEAGYEFKGIK